MSEIEKAVQKSTTSKAVQPKRKHVRSIVIEVWNENTARTFFTEISKRPLDQNDVVCFKALTVVHKVLQEGPRQALIDGYFRLQWIDNLREHWLRQSRGQGYNELCNEYGLFIKDKVLFHHRHTEFEGDFSLEKFKKYVKVETLEMDKCIELVSQLMDLQDSVFKLQRVIIEPRNVNDCKAGALIPLVLESFAIYTLLTFFLTKMVEKVDSMDVIQYLIERFYSEYMILRDFYINASAIRSVSSIIAVPQLPTDPPQFTIPATRKPKQPKSRRNTPTLPRREIPPPDPTTLLFQQAAAAAPQIPLYSQPAPVPYPQQPPPEMWSPFQTAPAPAPAPLPVAPFPTNFQSTPLPAPTPAPNPFQSLPPQPQQAAWVTFPSDKPSDPFSNLVAPLSSSSATRSTTPTSPTLLSTPAPQPISSTPTPPPQAAAKTASISTTNVASVQNVAAAPQQATTTPAPAAQAAQPEKTRVITKVITKTITNTTEINALKERIEELERLNAELTEKNNQYARRLAELERALEGERQAHSDVQAALDDALDARERDRWDRALTDIANSKETVETLLAQLDSPTNLGNPEATASLVVEDISAVLRTATRLLDVSRSGDDVDPALNQKELHGALSAVSAALRGMFSDAKGASRQLEDPAVSQRLLNGARNVGMNALSLLEALRMQGGKPQDEEDNKQLGDGFGVLQKGLEELIETSKTVELNIQQQSRRAIEVQQQEHERVEIELKIREQQEQNGLDLDDLAERELRAAAKTIEDAANALIAAKAAKKPRAPNDTKPDVAEAILEAAMAIAGATSSLVSSAAVAQRERAETGRARAAQGVPYKRDPTWAEGLISAAKSVAHATAALVGVANEAVQGKTGEEGLIAVSKAVAAATSQLVAAARAKADVNSPTQEKLSSAARSVSHATSLLVAAARAAAMQEETEEATDYSKMSATGFKVKEMEQQMKVLRLEKELQKARNGLADMRKQEYAVPK